jgi:two-component system CheB/CheR fusion protein
VDNALASVQPEIATRRHALEVSIEPEDFELDGDQVRVEQILVNLLQNAARYTEPEGRLGLEVRRDGDRLIARVRDSGVGLSEEELARVFEPFYQAHKGSGGLGIGLGLARKLAELHGGTLRASSDGLRRGSVFELELPRVRDDNLAEPEPVADEDDGTLAGALVLLVDDHEDSLRAFSQVLSSHCRVAVACTGAEALEQARKLLPDAVLLDLGLPDISGIEVARRLRAEPAFAELPLVAVTGFGDAGSAEEVESAGFDAHLIKPVEVRALLTQLRRLLRERTARAGSEPSRGEAP